MTITSHSIVRFAITAALRHASAANRHGVGLAALIALLVLPFTQLGKPSGRVLGDGAPALKPESAPRPPDGTEPGDLLKQPIFSTRTVEASVTLEDGQMVVLGGLQRKWTPDVPGADAGGSPIQKGAEQGAKTLMVLVTARVLAP